MDHREILALAFEAHREPGYAEAIRRNADADDIIASALAAMDNAVGVERVRCLKILQLARQGEIGTDLRSLISRIQNAEAVTPEKND